MITSMAQSNEGGTILSMMNQTGSYVLESTELKKSLTKAGCNKQTKDVFDKALWFHLAGQYLPEVLTVAEAFTLEDFMARSKRPEGFPDGLEGRLNKEFGMEFKGDPEFNWKELFQV